MPIKTAQFKIQGMNKDNSESAFPEKFAYDIRNMRIDARTDNTLLSLTNERGNSLIENELQQQLRLLGNPIGYAVINDFLVLFTHNSDTQTDYIYKISTDGRWMTPVTLFEGDLDFKENWKQYKPLEALAWYESDNIQKVYWLDGIHQPRMINIANSNQVQSIGNLYYGYDFVQKLELQETVQITQGSNGQFHSGIAQYFITYYNKNGVESNIAWQSPLMYVAFDDRGGSPEDIVPKSFTLQISNIDQNYDFMRLYCVQRTTLNGEVYVRKVQDFPKGTNSITYTDNGVVGESVDATYLLYVGGDELIAGCFTQKDQVLFFGDIQLSNLFEERTQILDETIAINTESYKRVPEDSFDSAIGKYYHHRIQFEDQDYDNNVPQAFLSQGNGNVSTFKYLETYRFGIQFQYDNGKWSNVIYVGDKQIERHVEKYNGYYTFSMPVITLTQTFLNTLAGRDRIKKVRPVCVFPSTYERDVICQGILCPTVYNVNDRVAGRTFSYSSWFSRPNAPDNIELEYDTSDPNNPIQLWPEDLTYDISHYPLNPYAVRTSDFKDKGCWTEFRHNHGLPSPSHFNGEIQMQFKEWGGMVNPLLPAISNPSTSVKDLTTPESFNQYFANGFNIDQSIFTMHSPDIEFNDNIQNTALKNAKLRIIGYVPVHANSGDISVNATNPEKYKAYQCEVRYSNSNTEFNTIESVNEINGRTSPTGFYDEKVGVKVNSDYGWFNLINGPYWQDKLYNPHFVGIGTHGSGISGTTSHYVNTEYIKYGFVIYPWQQHGSLSNGDTNDAYSILKTKILSNLKYSRESVFFSPDTNHYGTEGFWTSFNEEYDGNDTGLSDAVYIDSINHFTMLNSPYGNSVGYDGNMDKILAYNKHDWSPRMSVFKTDTINCTYSPGDWNYVIPDYDTANPISVHYADEPLGLPAYIDSYFSGYNTPNTNEYTIQDYYYSYNDGVPYSDISLSSNGGTYPFLPTNWHSYYYHTPLAQYYIGNYAIAEYRVNSDQPISMRYKCSPHIVMALKNQTHFNNGVSIWRAQRCLPTACKKVYDSSNDDYVIQPINPISSAANSVHGHTVVKSFETDKLYFDPNFNNAQHMTGCLQDYVNQALFQDASNPSFVDETHGFYWLAELYRDDIANKFGGTSEEALMNNVWHVCGEPVSLAGKSTLDLECTEGDTFYQRYDHLKTLPYSENDENQVIEIVSFMCESRTNLDGRYDKLRGVDNAELITPEVFNSINKVYSQLDNYLAQTYIREEDINTYLPNSVIWTDKKINGEEVDIWTQLHTENLLDLEGKNGKINALKTFRNEIYAFQDSAIANILFNSRTALATTEGSPVQLATSGLVEGKQYITNSMGCLNKWSICETPIGLVFTDDLNKSIMAIGDGFENLSEKYGMSTWTQSNTSNIPWDLSFPSGSMVTYYDRNNKDILFVTKNEALAYSIRLGAFTSFYSYEGVPFIVNYKDKVIDIIGDDNYTQLWSHNTGPYNSFFGETKPFGVTLVVNANPVTDKIFNTVEYRADFFSSNGAYQPNETFSSIKAWNEYQDTLEQPIANVTAIYPNNIKKKFRMWRVDIPRNYGTMDRIRNPWTYIELKKNIPEYRGKVQLHDIQVHYTE